MSLQTMRSRFRGSFVLFVTPNLPLAVHPPGTPSFGGATCAPTNLGSGWLQASRALLFLVSRPISKQHHCHSAGRPIFQLFIHNSNTKLQLSESPNSKLSIFTSPHAQVGNQIPYKFFSRAIVRKKIHPMKLAGQLQRQNIPSSIEDVQCQ